MLPLDELAGREPEADLLLGALNAVRAVADVAADVLLSCELAAMSRRSWRSYKSVVTTDGARGGGKGVGGAEDGCSRSISV